VITRREEGEHLGHEGRGFHVADRRHGEELVNTLPAGGTVGGQETGFGEFIGLRGGMTGIDGGDDIVKIGDDGVGQFGDDEVVLGVGGGDVGGVEGGFDLEEPGGGVVLPELGEDNTVVGCGFVVVGRNGWGMGDDGAAGTNVGTMTRKWRGSGRRGQRGSRNDQEGRSGNVVVGDGKEGKIRELTGASNIFVRKHSHWGDVNSDVGSSRLTA